MSGKTTAGILTLRLCIGGYLVYLAYSLVVPLPTDTKMRVISIVFAVRLFFCAVMSDETGKKAAFFAKICQLQMLF